MYILNVTVHLDETFRQNGVIWLQECFIPQMMKTDKFIEMIMTRVMVPEQNGGSTYSIQFKTKNKAQLKAYYLENDAQIFRAFRTFGNQMVFFRTEMEVIQQQ